MSYLTRIVRFVHSSLNCNFHVMYCYNPSFLLFYYTVDLFKPFLCSRMSVNGKCGSKLKTASFIFY